MHSEDLSDHEIAVNMFKSLIEESEEKKTKLSGDLKGFLNFEYRHKELIEKYGRFPYRNKVLGRESTPQEIQFIQNFNGW